MAELRALVGTHEAQAERLKFNIAAVEGGERNDIATLLAALPAGAPSLQPVARSDGVLPSKAATASLMKMLTAISKHKWAYPFKRAVTEKEAPDYKDIIKQPMDFSTIRKRVECGQVSSLTELRGDLSLVFSNAMLYNAKGSDYYKMAESLAEHTRTEFERLLAETANASHLSPEASELLRGAGMVPNPTTLASQSTRLRSSQPAEAQPAPAAAAAAVVAPVVEEDVQDEDLADLESGGVSAPPRGGSEMDDGVDDASPTPAARARAPTPSSTRPDSAAGAEVEAALTPAAKVETPVARTSHKRGAGAASEGGSARARSRR
mmetsp:Transcript_15445/g.39181  ORF Transcript_15445/g.39181 Transcript_15445/m.39181 type:complete len:321 (+) Transcript_15445:3-965(+)